MAAGQGTCGFAVNRRNNLEPDVPKLIEQGALKGPVDHTVPVLAVYLPDGKLKAVLFGYACHNTVMDFYKWSGDYAGFAQLALEKSHPDATAMFFMGCGADQNALPAPRARIWPSATATCSPPPSRKPCSRRRARSPPSFGPRWRW